MANALSRAYAAVGFFCLSSRVNCSSCFSLDADAEAFFSAVFGFAVSVGVATKRPAEKIRQAAAAPTKRTANFIPAFLVPQNGRGIRIFSEGFNVTLTEDFHQPVMKVVHRMVLNRAEAAVVFFAGFIDFSTQSVTDVFVLAAQLTSFGRNNLMSCMETLAARFARRCNSFISAGRLATSNATTSGSATTGSSGISLVLDSAAASSSGTSSGAMVPTGISAGSSAHSDSYSGSASATGIGAGVS